MSLILNASTSSGLVVTADNSGSFVFQSNGANPVTLPNTGTGTVAVQGVSTNIVTSTAQATTSGTSILFTGLPSYARRITVMFSGVSGAGSSNMLVQLGSGSVQTTGYVSTGSYISTSVSTTSSTAGFIFWRDNAAFAFTGHMIFTIISGTTWISSHLGLVATTQEALGAGSVTLSGALDRINITTVNGTDAFDAGSVNILYE